MNEVAAAYDAIADSYDASMAGDAWMRRVLWAHYSRLFAPGARVLDAACGTGPDTLYLAARGIHVTGVDVSPEMIARLRQKARQRGLEAHVDARVLRLTELHALPADGFDGIVSAFAGLNTLPDLSTFATDAARLLKPAGRLVVHLLNRRNPWAYLELFLQLRWSELGRGVLDVSVGDRAVRHFLFSPDELYRDVFAPGFRLRGAYGLGALRPPPSARRLPLWLVSALEELETRLRARRPFRTWGRFFVLDLERREDAGA